MHNINHEDSNQGDQDDVTIHDNKNSQDLERSSTGRRTISIKKTI